MDFDQAINAHIEWKTRLLKYIENPDNSLKSAVVANDKLCQLGGWIVDEGRTYGRIPEYQRLICDHSMFHRHAGQIVERVNRGEHVTENDITHPDSAYNMASRNVIHSIMAVRRKLARNRADEVYAETVETVENPSRDEDSATQKFLLKLAETSPDVLKLIEKTATEEAIEIIKLISTYNSAYTFSPAMANILLDSIRTACTSMMMELANICKRNGR